MALVPDAENPNFSCLKAAFLAMEPAKNLISLARQTCGGSLTEEVQNFILELCVENSEHVVGREKNKIIKKISFLLPLGIGDQSSQKNLVVSLHCSLNLLEGDTGCALWPSSLFLSEFILSYPLLFSDKVCFEVILTDGDRSSLENMQCNLELNNLTSEKVHGLYLPWECATESELSKYQHDCVLGADIIYDPRCVPHLIQVLCMLLKSKRNFTPAEDKEASVAYIATVIRSKETFDYFLVVAEEAQLSVVDITEEWQPLNLLPYMLSYDRMSIRLYRISYLS